MKLTRKLRSELGISGRRSNSHLFIGRPLMAQVLSFPGEAVRGHGTRITERV